MKRCVAAAVTRKHDPETSRAPSPQARADAGAGEVAGAAVVPNAFIGATRKPTEKQLATELGPAKVVWDRLLNDLARQFDVTGREWKSYSVKAGWALRLMRKKRTILWLAPCRGAIRAAVILGDRAVQDARESRLPRRVLEAIDGATRYSEGTAVRIEFKTARDIGTITRLVQIKLAH